MFVRAPRPASPGREPIEHRERALPVEGERLLRVIRARDEIPLNILFATYEIVTKLACEIV